MLASFSKTAKAACASAQGGSANTNENGPRALEGFEATPRRAAGSKVARAPTPSASQVAANRLLRGLARLDQDEPLGAA